jgi:hypothetical protein
MRRGPLVTYRTIFLTGMQRSGTTLLARLLDDMEQVSLLSQPFPLLFVEAKRAFLRSLGSEDRYPLGHLFLESRYCAADFARFLKNWRTSSDALAEIFARMDAYSGQYTRFTPDQLSHAFANLPSDADFATVVGSLDRRLARHPDALGSGSKETVCEELVPHLLDRGFVCVIILRDPRDVIASLNHGRGQEFGGEVKPTLFNIRNWRKSVAVALAMEEHPLFHWCRYEDLVRDPSGETARLRQRIGLEPARLTADLRDENGETWRGNSSHGERKGVSTSSVGVYERVLSTSAAMAIEAACLPELQLLGYETSLTRHEACDRISAFEDPYPNARDGMEADASTPENLELERWRLDRLIDPPGVDSVRWFLFERTHARLREAFRP